MYNVTPRQVLTPEDYFEQIFVDDPWMKYIKIGKLWTLYIKTNNKLAFFNDVYCSHVVLFNGLHWGLVV